MERSTYKSKNNPFLLSSQVKDILQNNGYTSIFNYNDYKLFKTKCKNAFNKAQAIAEQFMTEAEPSSNDLNNYIF